MFVSKTTYVRVLNNICSLGWEHMFMNFSFFVFTLTCSHHRPQTPIYRAFEGREG